MLKKAGVIALVFLVATGGCCWAGKGGNQKSGENASGSRSVMRNAGVSPSASAGQSAGKSRVGSGFNLSSNRRQAQLNKKPGKKSAFKKTWNKQRSPIKFGLKPKL